MTKATALHNLAVTRLILVLTTMKIKSWAIHYHNWNGYEGY